MYNPFGSTTLNRICLDPKLGPGQYGEQKAKCIQKVYGLMLWGDEHMRLKAAPNPLELGTIYMKILELRKLQHFPKF